MLALLSVIAEGGEKAKEVVNPVIPDVPEVVWGAIAFFLLLILMNAVLLPPIRQAMRKREEQLRSDDEAAERAAVESEQVRRDYDATLAEARTEGARIVDEARQQAETRRAEIVKAATDEVAAQRQAALAELESDRAAALASLRTQVAGIAVAAAGKVVQQDLDVSANQSVVDAAISAADA
ncbi:MAG: F0F1 ATP synthase subunit B [Acidimicrobiales bacterium]